MRYQATLAISQSRYLVDTALDAARYGGPLERGEPRDAQSGGLSRTLHRVRSYFDIRLRGLGR